MSKVVFLGDVSLLTPNIKSEYFINGEFVFNLEYVITNNTEFPKKNKVNLYSNERDFKSVFNKLPIAVSLANNHIFDYGVRGFKDTTSFLKDDNIPFFGAGKIKERYNNPYITTVNKTKVGLIAYSLFNEDEGDYGVSFFDKEKAIQDISTAQSQNVNTIIVNIHWGIEEAPLNTYNQQKIGRFLIDQGVDLVIGHHPHCVQPFEIYKGKHIFYSIGNCIFPDFGVDAFYDENYIPRRVYRKRQLRHNKISYAVNFDVERKVVVAIDKLLFDKSILRKIGSVDIEPQPLRMSQSISTLIKQKRKYHGFIWSNFLVDRKLFDLKAIKHEIELKKRG